MRVTHYGVRGLSADQMDRQPKTSGTRQFRTTKGYLTMCGTRVKGERIASIRESVQCEHCRETLARFDSSMSNAIESMTKETGV